MIAERYGVSVEAIRAANALTDVDTLSIGQEIVIPRAGAPSAPPASAPTATARPTAPVVHTVKPGDTISTIAELYGVTSQSIVRYNGLANADSLSLGQQLVIPQ